MTVENNPPTPESHEHDPRRRASRPDSNALIQGLEHLRESIEERLGRLEMLAREHGARPIPKASELEQRLQQRIDEYEKAQLRLRTQADQHEQEWHAALEQVEADRARLAEAWERLEREQIEAAGAAAPQGKGHARPTAAEGDPSHAPRPRLDPADAPNDTVTHAILQQFHALRNDVRRNARQRGPNLS